MASAVAVNDPDIQFSRQRTATPQTPAQQSTATAATGGGVSVGAGLSRQISYGLTTAISTLSNGTITSFSNGSALTPGGSDLYYCQICFEYARRGDAAFTLSACGHTFCRACVREYISKKVVDGQTYPICFLVTSSDGPVQGGRGGAGAAGGDGGGGAAAGAASGEGACGQSIAEADIYELLSTEPVTLAKYQWFKLSKENSNARSCSKCSEAAFGDPQNPSMTCPRCGHRYCFEHGDAHGPAMTCAAYELSMAEESKKNRALLSETTRPCPGCASAIEKAGGCNQMKCYNCGTHFCWLCLRKVDGGALPRHFEWWNVTGCPNQQMQEDAQPGRRSRVCLRVLSLIQVVIIGPPALLLTLMASVACCCCLPLFGQGPVEVFSGCMSGWGYVVMALLLLPFVIAIGVPILVILGLCMAISCAASFAAKCAAKCRRAAAGDAATGDLDSISDDATDIAEAAEATTPDARAAAAAALGGDKPRTLSGRSFADKTPKAQGGGKGVSTAASGGFGAKTPKTPKLRSGGGGGASKGAAAAVGDVVLADGTVDVELGQGAA